MSGQPFLLLHDGLVLFPAVAICIEVLQLLLEDLLIGMSAVIDIVAVDILDPVPVELVIDPVPLPGVGHPTVQHRVAEDP